MIYGNLVLAEWRTARPEGEEPESSFESPRLRLFFFGTLYNGDVLRAAPGDSNAKIAADAFLDGSFTIVYYADTECGVAARQSISRYSKDEIMQRWDTLFKSILSGETDLR